MFKELIYHLKRPGHFIKTGLLVGLAAQLKYKFPARQLKIICITGTDGKTTSSTLLYTVLKQAGKKVALLSTVAAYIGDQEIDTGFHVTTPDPAQLQKFMRQMVDDGYEYLILEATSHGIYQYRLWGVTPFLVGVTNITMEHLDYHVTYDLYVEAKMMLAQKAKIVVANADDELSIAKIRKAIKDSHAKLITYSAQDEIPKVISGALATRFHQTYNRMNGRLVYTIAKQLEIDDKDVKLAIQKFTGVPGRMEVAGERKGIKVIVDFAHTPNALREVLTNIRAEMKAEKRRGKLIAVFGAAGLRDWKKRPAMGKFAAEIADYAVFTAEDPRTEDVWAIIRQMKQNLGTYYDKVVSVADRRQAIEFALKKLAKPGDVVGIFGKGHEKSMCYGTTEYPWSDITVSQEILRSL